MSDLTHAEQQRVRATLHHLRRTVGGWIVVAAALHYSPESLEKIANARGRPVTPRLAFRVARLVDVGVDELLGGWYRPGACPRCGYLPDPGADPTRADDTLLVPPEHNGVLRLVE